MAEQPKGIGSHGDRPIKILLPRTARHSQINPSALVTTKLQRRNKKQLGSVIFTCLQFGNKLREFASGTWPKAMSKA